MNTQIVDIPACEMHQGIFNTIVKLTWVCPVCGGPRGEIFTAFSFDGSRRLVVSGWRNACGHVDKYSDVRMEAMANGLNDPPLTHEQFDALNAQEDANRAAIREENNWSRGL